MAHGLQGHLAVHDELERPVGDEVARGIRRQDEDPTSGPPDLCHRVEEAFRELAAAEVSRRVRERDQADVLGWVGDVDGERHTEHVFLWFGDGRVVGLDLSTAPVRTQVAGIGEVWVR